jgi:hypothetical protein
MRHDGDTAVTFTRGREMCLQAERWSEEEKGELIEFCAADNSRQSIFLKRVRMLVQCYVSFIFLLIFAGILFYDKYSSLFISQISTHTTKTVIQSFSYIESEETVVSLLSC